MQKLLFVILLTFSTAVSAQYNVRPLDSLINKEEPAWPIVKGWIDSATNKVQVLPVDTAKAKKALYDTQVTTRSPMGAVIYETGGILVDGGWIRILGSGSAKLTRSVPDWNRGKSFRENGERPLFLLVADDAIGGFFAINGGKFGFNQGNVFYLAPDNLQWEDLEINYTDFLLFCFSGDVDGFYEGQRWKGWEKDVPKLGADKSFLFTPALWVRPEREEGQRAKKAVPVEEQYKVMMDMRKQLKLE
ncbi:DUF2625 domain-containing protein [Chitinophaga sp. YIM B06452]|uniref:DUF2625 domain-containing protein n=1 Tax=Chitinophaga sp. YIM B06452 TaxID=3082158 RepID=UPI0031FE487D